MEDKHLELGLKRTTDQQLKETILNIKIAKNELEAAFDSLSDIVILIDSDGNTLRCNRTIEQWQLGHVKELEGIKFHRLFHPDCYQDSCHLLDNWEEAKQHVIANRCYEYQVFDNCMNRFLQVQFRPISENVRVPVSQGGIFCVLTIKDVTVNKVNEIQLAQTSAEFKTIFQVLLDQYIRINCDGTILDVQTNRNIEASMFPNDTVGKNIASLVSPDLLDKFNTAIEEVKKTNTLVTLEYTTNRGDDRLFFEARFLPLMEDQIIMIIQDTTEKKKLESVAEAVDMMEKLGYIFSAVRHEIGNPVNAIKVTLSVLKKNIGQFSNEKIYQYAERALKDISRIEYLLKSFRTFSMFEDLVITEIPFKEFLDSFIELMKPEFEKNEIAIHLDLLPGYYQVAADARALHHVLLNIISNAIDAMKDTRRKRIEICAKKSVCTKRSRNTVRITISDNGKGFTEDQRRNVFKPFYTTKSHGTGLGLVIVKKILTRLHGDIEIDSSELNGTTVTITLPEGGNDQS